MKKDTFYATSIKFSKTDNIISKHTGIELFAGAGGLALGLEKAGFEELEFVEFNHTACDTLRLKTCRTVHISHTARRNTRL